MFISSYVGLILSKMQREYEFMAERVINDMMKGISIEYTEYELFDKFKNYFAELIEFQEQNGFSERDKVEIKKLIKRYMDLFNKQVNYSNELENKHLYDLTHY